MYLTAFLTQELARIAQLERDEAARHARLVRITEGEHPADHAIASLLTRITLAVRPTPAACTPSC
jgi:hypothetical protein